MYSIGLTGNRMSGKSLVSNGFAHLGVPVFDADLILKYLLNYRPDITMSVLGNMGDEFLVQGNYINMTKFDNDIKFNELLNLVDFQIMESYRKFKERNKDALYTIFKCSWIFERDLASRFNSIISVYATKDERALRYRLEKGASLQETYDLLKYEISDLKKNASSHYVIHAYDCNIDIFKQINDIDKKIVEHILNKKEIQHD